jgi:hypothetical protein
MPIDVNGYKITSDMAKTFSYKDINTIGLKLYIDASVPESYSGSGTTWYDFCGNTANNYNGTLTNGPTYSSGNGGYILFDGTNDYVTSFGTAIVPGGATSYTVSVWIYRNRNNIGAEEVLSQWTTATSSNAFFFGFNNSNVRFSDNWNDVSVTGAGTTGVWMNLVGVNLGGSNAYIYLNGTLSATKGSALTYTGTGPFLIGRQGEYTGGEYFGGRISSVMVYNRVLLSTEILQNYNIQKGKFGL